MQIKIISINPRSRYFTSWTCFQALWFSTYHKSKQAPSYLTSTSPVYYPDYNYNQYNQTLHSHELMLSHQQPQHPAHNQPNNQQQLPWPQGNNYVRKEKVIRLPYSQDEALQVLMNWNFARTNKFTRSLRKNMINHNKLTEKQMAGLRHAIFAGEHRYLCLEI